MPHKGNFRPAPSRIDAEFPFQVALAEDLCVDANYGKIVGFCEQNGMRFYTRYVSAVWPCGRQDRIRLHCFATLREATLFKACFGGKYFDPRRDRENGRTSGAWRRSGAWQRLLESGPLKIPPVLRD